MSKFDEIAGYKEEKNELINLCNFIKNRQKLYEMGGKLPKGVYIVGPNGVGKTKLAESFINESHCESIKVCYNDIDNDNEFTSYIKTKFKEAASKTPCILLIDELDKLIGNGNRFFNPDSFNKSRIVLSEINKYSSVEGLFLLMVANDRYIIDDSIVRSGRIDNIIRMNLPNEAERLEIIKYYMRNRTHDETFDYEYVSKLTRDFSGADIETLLNNSVLTAFKNDRNYITYNDIVDNYYKKMFASSQKESILDLDSMHTLAYHEAGHAVLSILASGKSPDCISILPRAKTSGFVSNISDETKFDTFVSEERQIQICLAGMASEELFAKNRTMNSYDDIQKARKIAALLIRFNAYSGFEATQLPEDIPSEVSNDRKREAEKAEDRLLNRMFKLTKKALLNNKKIVDAIACELIKNKILNSNHIDDIIKKIKGPNGPMCLSSQLKREEIIDVHN